MDEQSRRTTDRPTWDEYFMDIAFAVAERSTCDRAHVGSVLVRDRRILTTGYNGAPAGLPHCDDVGHLMVDGHCVRTLHAEQNAIIQAALHGVSIEGATAYVTHQPCLTCAKMLINAGIRRVVYAGNYPDPYSREFFAQAGVELVHLPRIRPPDSVYQPTRDEGAPRE
ncbi:MAG TPA: cytidine/deoxycytidylate deaminase family protein [Caldilineaceae bacterium]|nr:cytidine/deoxycytidylate deaminase family protein [Caldilineaceae bacterium]